MTSHLGLNLTSLGVAWNERTYNAAFIKNVKEKLISVGLSRVKTIAPDSWGDMWKIVPDMLASTNGC